MNTSKRALELLAGGISFAEATILKSSGSTPRRAGTSMLILEDGSIIGTVGGGGLEGTVIAAAKDVLADRQARTVHFELNGADAAAAGAICGGNADVSIEYIDAADTLNRARFESKLGGDDTAYIFGAGHCGEKLCHILSTVGFRVVVIDDRAEFANDEKCPDADELIIPPAMDTPFDMLEFGPGSYIVIVTRGHAHDETVLRRALRTDAGYIGMIGSRGKREGIYRSLRSDGYTDADIARVYSPIGIAIGADTPEEIAISIAAEMIQVRSQKK